MLNEINARTLLESRLAVDQARRIENAESLIIDIERSMRQHDILNTASTAEVARNHLRNHQTRLTSMIWSGLDQRLHQQQDDAERALQLLACQTAALVALTLLLVIWSSRRIAALIQQLHRRILAIGGQKDSVAALSRSRQ